MPSILESLTSLLGKGDIMEKLGSLAGEDADNTNSALEAAGPALIGGLAEKASADGGTDAVTALMDDADGSILDDVGGFLDGGDDAAGTGVLDGIFGEDREDLLDGLASQSGVGAGAFTKLLPMLAPMVMGLLAKLRADDDLDGDGVAALLGSERESLESDGKLGDWFGNLLKGGGALAALGGAAALAKDKLGAADDKVVDALSAAKDKLESVNGDDADDEAAQDADDDDAGAGAVTKEVPAAAGAAAATTMAKREAAETRQVAAGGGSGGSGLARYGDRRGPLGWLWWLVGAVALVLVFGWLLNQCGNSDEDTEASGGATTEEDDGSDADSSDADGTEEDAEGTDSEAGDGDGADLQAALDAALGAGISGVVDGDVATLTGTADSEDAKIAAEEAAVGIEGISSVVNQIEVDDSDGDDSDDGDSAAGGASAELQGLVASALAEAAPDGSSVSATVDGSNVTLTGSVDSEDAKAALEAAVTGVDGVTSVDNQVELSDGDASDGDADGDDSASGDSADSDSDSDSDSDADADSDSDDDSDSAGGSTAASGTDLGAELGLTPITFEYRSAQITANSETVLAEVVAYLEENEVDVEIQGHTDSDGTDAENMALSMRRADSVKAFLEAAGISADRLTAAGLGESVPKVDNDSADNKALNRRIEFVVGG